MDINIPYGHGQINLNIPAGYRINVIQPRSKPEFLPDFLGETKGQEEMVEVALGHPYGMGPLEAILSPQSTVAVIVNDVTRATPTKIMINPILERLAQIGVPHENIDIVFANGSHRAQTDAEKEALLGRDIINAYRVYEHDAHDRSKLQLFGYTSRGTPVLINQVAANADLRILTGMIKPHCQAAYSGGGKSILPGIAGIETIVCDHNFNAVKCGRIGVLEGNLIRSDIEEAAQLIGKSFIINVILNPEKKIVAAVAGDMIAAHRAGCRILDSICRFTLKKQVDIGIAACGAPVDINLYQAINGIASLIKLKEPVIKKGGVIILAAECREGMGHSIFRQWASHTPLQILDGLEQSRSFTEGQWGVQVLAECMEYAKIIVVSEVRNRTEMEAMGLVFKQRVSEAVNEALSQSHSLHQEVLVLPNAPYTILDLEGGEK
jgi:nickel-dependent lactate racemase